jgi:hypothetical protein
MLIIIVYADWLGVRGLLKSVCHAGSGSADVAIFNAQGKWPYPSVLRLVDVRYRVVDF